MTSRTPEDADVWDPTACHGGTHVSPPERTAFARLCQWGLVDAYRLHHREPGRFTWWDYRAGNFHKNFGMRIEISREDDLLLDTGGGLKRASWFFLEGNSNEPFLLHNVDVISSIDLGRMLEAHDAGGALATLAVQDRSTGRYLLFDEQAALCGRRTGREGKPELVRTGAPAPKALAFSGIHVISPRLLMMIEQDGAFSIIDTYLRLAAKGERIAAFRADEYYWRDLGKADDLKLAAQDLNSGKVS